MTTITPSAEGLPIINQALMLLREPEMTDFADNDIRSRAGRRLYEPAIKTTMSALRWHFCSGKIQIQRLAEAPEDQWEAGYRMPTNPAVIKINAVRVGDVPILFQQFENYIACNAQPNDVVILDYTYRALEAIWQPEFEACAVRRLASDLAVPITGKTELYTLYDESYRTMINKAAITEWTQETSRPLDTKRLVRARGTGTRG